MKKKKKAITEKKSVTNLKEAKRAMKFVVFSCTAGVIQVGAFTLMNELLQLKYWPSYLTALVLSVIYNFTVNRKYTFKSAANIPSAMMKVLGYYIIFTPVSLILGEFCTDFLEINEYIVLGVTMVINMVTEFLFCRFSVYKNNVDNAKQTSSRVSTKGDVSK